MVRTVRSATAGPAGDARNTDRGAGRGLTLRLTHRLDIATSIRTCCRTAAVPVRRCADPYPGPRMTTLTAPDVAVAAEGTSASRVRSPAELLADPWRALCAAVVLLVAVVGLDALGDPDVWWHLRLGRWILDHH